MSNYIVEFDFIENGHECHTAYSGPEASSEEEAVAVAREWFGFDRDNIEVIHTKVNYLHPKGLTACKTTPGVGLHALGSLT